MKKVLVAAACACFLAPSVAKAAPSLLVTGAGASATSGQVVINAHATGPIAGPFIPVAPATGFIRVRGSFYGDVTGSVTCIGLADPNAAIVSGTLSTPFVSGGFSYPNFSFLVATATPQHPSWITLFADDIGVGFLGPCGNSLFFAAGVPDLPSDLVVNGNFQILRGT
jgi:hypothetical protein